MNPKLTSAEVVAITPAAGDNPELRFEVRASHTSMGRVKLRYASKSDADNASKFINEFGVCPPSPTAQAERHAQLETKAEIKALGQISAALRDIAVNHPELAARCHVLADDVWTHANELERLSKILLVTEEERQRHHELREKYFDAGIALRAADPHNFDIDVAVGDLIDTNERLVREANDRNARILSLETVLGQIANNASARWWNMEAASDRASFDAFKDIHLKAREAARPINPVIQTAMRDKPAAGTGCRVAFGEHLSPHLAQCSECNRKSWAEYEVSAMCGTTQPDGKMCGGSMIPNL